MKTGKCRCGNRIFFSNYQCLACRAMLGRCNQCQSLTSFSASGPAFRCDSCQAPSYPCRDRTHQACNSCNRDADLLCQWCEFTDVIPDLRKPGNVRRWSALEAAKRRLLLELEDLQLPPFIDNLRETHPLRFSVSRGCCRSTWATPKSDVGTRSRLVTINMQEADSVQRERLRVELGEPQRTLIGHMRHEVGHYIDWSFASRVAADDYHRLFGDPKAIEYETAMNTYYQRSAPNDWAQNHVSQYATMHPWEDFAETVNVYLDIMAIAVTANDQGFSQLDLSPVADAPGLVSAVLEIVVAVSEFNADLGLHPLLPERLPPAVIEKLTYIHALRAAP